jgi:hypothetical protein
MKRLFLAGTALVAVTVGPALSARAENFTFDDSDFKISWDNTVKYSTSYRLRDPKASMLTDTNLDDGNRNFKAGFTSNRADILSELTAGTRDYGFRVSGAAWFDTEYLRGNDNDSPATANQTSVANDRFTGAARTVHGRNVELMDAFAYGNFSIDDTRLTTRLGRHSLIYGESLFFGANGVAAAQQPIDLIKLLSVPSTQFKEVLLPVWQASGTVQLRENLSIGGYYQLQWRNTRLPASGSAFSTADFVGDGAERIVVGGPVLPGGGPAAFWRGKDIKARDSGQFGAQIRYTPEDTDYEFGLYFAQYHDKTPQLYLVPNANPTVGQLRSGNIGELRHVYPEDVRTVGASVSTVVGRANVAGEVSYRWNAPLVSDPQTALPGVLADNKDHPLYAVGRTLHAQASAIYAFTPNGLWDGASIAAEIAWNTRVGIDKNPAALDPNSTRSALGIRGVFTPTYFQIANGLDVNVPIGLGYTPYGRSSAVGNFNGGASRGGDISVGADFTYQSTWSFGVNATHYFGPADVLLTAANPTATPVQRLTFKQTMKGRDFIGAYLKRSF